MSLLKLDNIYIYIHIICSCNKIVAIRLQKCFILLCTSVQFCLCGRWNWLSHVPGLSEVGVGRPIAINSDNTYITVHFPLHPWHTTLTVLLAFPRLYGTILIVIMVYLGGVFSHLLCNQKMSASIQYPSLVSIEHLSNVYPCYNVISWLPTWPVCPMSSCQTDNGICCDHKTAR